MSAAAPEMTTTALANWFGSNRMLASTVGRYFDGCAWVGVPFAGGCCELPYIKCRSGIAADLHRHVINLARVVREPELKSLLVERLDATLFHPDELAAAQRRCLDRGAACDASDGLCGGLHPSTLDRPDLDWAYDYFICSWMGRGGNAGKDAEFRQGMSVRWNANGGDSCTRFRSATESLNWWCPALARWNFVVLDCFEFLDLVKDEPGHGVYSDAPWPVVGDYTHRFSEAQQRRLAKRLGSFRRARVVVRYGDHPLIRELYPEPQWTWIRRSSRNQANGDCPEVLIINGPSFTEGARA